MCFFSFFFLNCWTLNKTLKSCLDWCQETTLLRRWYWNQTYSDCELLTIYGCYGCSIVDKDWSAVIIAKVTCIFVYLWLIWNQRLCFAKAELNFPASFLQKKCVQPCTPLSDYILSLLILLQSWSLQLCQGEGHHIISLAEAELLHGTSFNNSDKSQSSSHPPHPVSFGLGIFSPAHSVFAVFSGKIHIHLSNTRRLM